MDVQGFRFHDAPIQWALEPVDCKLASCATLLAKFLEEWSYDQKPLAWARNPVDKDGRPYYEPITDWIVAPYRRNFRLVIERQFGEMFGPHPVRLYYESWQIPGELAWIAICQIRAMWHSDDRMLLAVQEAVNAGELYQSEKTAETLVLL